MQIVFASAIFMTCVMTCLTDSVESIAVLGLIELFLSICMIAKQKSKLLSICVVFLIFSYILHCGQYLLLIMDTGVIPTFNYIETVTTEALLQTGKYIIYAHGVLALGMLWKGVSINKINHGRIGSGFKDIPYIGDEYRGTLRNIAILFIVVGIFFSLRTTIALIGFMIRGGYYNTFAYYATYGGIRFQLGMLWVVGITILLMIYRNNKRQCRVLLLMSIIYLFVTMLTGGRMSALMNIVVLIYCYFNIVDKLKIGRFIIWGIIAIVLVQYIVNIGLSRTDGFGVSVDLGMSLKTLLGKVLAEFGGTSYTVALAMDHVPGDIPYAYCSTYFLSFMYILPNFGWSSWEIINKTVFTSDLRPFTNSGIGGSYIGEAYYNAGYFGLILIFVFGIILSRFERRMDGYIEERRWLKLIAYMGTLPYVFIMTRSFFKDIVRPFVWLTIAVWILQQMFSRRRI